MIADLAEDRVVEGVFAVASKRKLKTKGGAPYLALELVDPSGRIEARVWNDVELLDGRFEEGDAVRVLGKVEKFRDKLQLDVRTLEGADVDPQSLTPAARRDRDELAGFLEFLVAEVHHEGLALTVRNVLADADLKKRKGFIQAVKVPNGVAVVADTWWQAKTALEALPIEWDKGAGANVSSESIAKWLEEGLTADTNFVGNKQGDATAAIAGAAKKIEATYAYPYQNHACMEPMNATVLYTPDKCEVWTSTQNGEGFT